MRPSVEEKIVSVTNTLITAAVGLILLGGGAAALVYELKTPPTHSGHIYFFGGVAILGALVIRPDPIFSIVQRVVVIAGETNLPFIGNRRSTDKPPTPPTGTQ
jgi:hypothetical protein